MFPSFYLFLKTAQRLFKERGRQTDRSRGESCCSSSCQIKACKHTNTQNSLAGEPHVSQKRSSCLRLLLSFWVSLRSCRLLWVAPPFFPFCLALTREGTGGLVPLGFLAVCSSAQSWLWVSLCTYTGNGDRATSDTSIAVRNITSAERQHTLFPSDPRASGLQWLAVVHSPSAGVCGALWSELLSLPSGPPASPGLSAAPVSASDVWCHLSAASTPDAHWQKQQSKTQKLELLNE